MPGIPEAPLRLTLDPGLALPAPDLRARRLRDLLLIAISAGALAACDKSKTVDSVDSGYYDCGDPPSATYEASYVVDEGVDECPSSVPYERLFYRDNVGVYFYDMVDNSYTYDCRDLTSTSEAPADSEIRICTYTITCTTWSCCGYGRPYLDAKGEAVSAEHSEDPSWSRPLPERNSDLSHAERERLTQHWLKNAAAEHSSVAGFHRFALDLMAHGAPPELVRKAGEAAAQEIAHAVDCYTLASAYAGRRLGPKPLPLGSAAPVAESLAQLAAWTVRDGAVGETLAAYLASEALERATDPEVRRALERVVQDETAHAQLAWETLAWALSVGGDDVRDAIQGVFASLSYPVTPAEDVSPGLQAHGLLSPAQADAAARRCIDQVLRPVMASLLSQALAA